MTITIHGFAPSTFVQTACLVATEKALDYRLAPLEFKAASHLALLPFGRMPVLEHDGFCLFETAAIAIYLDGVAGTPALQPADPAERARMWQTISAALHYGYPALVADTLGDAGIDGADAEKVTVFLDYLDGEAHSMTGAQPTIADFYVFPMVRHHAGLAGRDALLAGRGSLERWFETMSVRTSPQALRKEA